MRAAPPFAPRACRWCGQALSALERMQGDTCRQLDCRRRSTDAGRAAEDAADIARRQQALALARQRPGLTQAPVLWLPAFQPHHAPVAAAARREHAAWLVALAATPSPAVPPPPAADAAPGPAIGGRVCAFCSGRCCTLGAHRHAFIDRALLERHAERATGGDVAAAALDYAARVPRTHVRGGCLYQGREGCVLPRTMRADICNTYRCEPLAEAERRSGSADGVLLAMAQPHDAPRAAWAHDGALVPLPRRARRKTVTPPPPAPAAPR
jgi:hypothetical protein